MVYFLFKNSFDIFLLVFYKYFVYDKGTLFYFSQFSCCLKTKVSGLSDAPRCC